MRNAEERLGPVFLCAYRADGMTHTARVRARNAAHATRKMRQIDWAPGCGPIGTPRQMTAPQAAPAGSWAALAGMISQRLPISSM